MQLMSGQYTPARECRPSSIEGVVCSFYYQKAWHPSNAYIRFAGKHLRRQRPKCELDDLCKDSTDQLPAELMRLSLNDIEVFAASMRGFNSLDEWLSYKDADGHETLHRSLWSYRMGLLDDARDSLHWLFSKDCAVNGVGLTFDACCDLSDGDIDPSSMRERFLTYVTGWLSKSPAAVEALRAAEEDEAVEKEVLSACG